MYSSAADHLPLWLRRWPSIVLLLAGALFYFGSYFRHGINFRDEGGTLTLLGQRLLEGEVPFRDVELGYNVGWFVPIVALFKITGASFVALRVYCFALSTLAAVLGFLTVERAARHAGMRRGAIALGLIAGAMLIAIPGMTFKNYNPLAVVANMWCLLGFVLARDTREASWRALAGGLVLGATWLVRIDLGTFFSLLWLATLCAGLFVRRRMHVLVAIAILPSSVLALHVPILWDASRRGYYAQFTAAYPNHWKMVLGKLGIGTTAAKPKPAPVAAPQPPAPPTPPPAVVGTWKNETLPRTTWQDVTAADVKKRDDVLGLFLLTWLPLPSLLLLGAWAKIRWFRGLRARAENESADADDSRSALAALVLIGASLTLFPQFFFWRPDASHLSEFGPGYWVAVLGAMALLGVGKTWRAPGKWLAVFLVLVAGIWVWRMFPDRWCGTIAARWNRKVLFEGENGVLIYENERTAAWMNEVLHIVRERSKPGEYLVAYPYHPSFNVFTGRPTYEHNVYIDNATAKPGWPKAAIERIEAKQPAVIVVGDWAINGRDASRFRNWAAPAYEHIRAHYDLAGTFDEKERFEVYVRRAQPGAPAR